MVSTGPRVSRLCVLKRGGTNTKPHAAPCYLHVLWIHGKCHKSLGKYHLNMVDFLWLSCVSLFFICCQIEKKKNWKKTRQPASSYRWACCYGPVLSQKQSVNIFFGRVRPNHVKTHGRRQNPWKAKRKNTSLEMQTQLLQFRDASQL